MSWQEEISNPKAVPIALWQRRAEKEFRLRKRQISIYQETLRRFRIHLIALLHHSDPSGQASIQAMIDEISQILELETLK